MRRSIIVALALVGGGVRAENLFPQGDFTDAKPNLAGDCASNGGKVELFTNRGNGNRCGRLVMGAAVTNKQGEVTQNASVWVGCADGKCGIAVKPDTTYRFSLELRGAASDVRVEYIEWTGPDVWRDMKSKATDVGRPKILPTWTRYQGTFKTGPKAQRAALHLQMYSSTAYSPLRHKPGDDVFFDNVVIEEQPMRDLAKLGAELGHPFAVARFRMTDAMTQPFVPETLFSKLPDSFRLVAVQNERKSLPLVLANLTDRPASYRVTVETCDDKELAKRDPAYAYIGRRGLAGFPSDQVEFRHSVAQKDADSAGAGTMLDALPKMDEACVVSIPAHDTRVVWFDFDTTGVAAGTYAGRLRVIPLMERGKWIAKGNFDIREYQGPMRDYPVELKVLPFSLPKEPPIPHGYFQSGINEGMFKAMLDLGMRESGVSPYDFHYGNGDVTLDVIRDQLRYAREAGVHLTWFVGFSCYRSLSDVTGAKPYASSAEHIEAFVAWLKRVKAAFNGLGVDDADYLIETWDEPEVPYLEEMVAAHTRVKKELPTVRLCLTLGAQGMGIEAMRRMAPLTDAWILWDYGYFERPDHLAFVHDQLAAGKHVAHYTCTTHASILRGSHYRSYRLRPWLGYLHGLSGHDLFWFSDAPGGYGAGDWKVAPWGELVYRSFDTFIPTVRSMCYREGQTDIKYLAMLKERLGSDSEVAAFLKEATVKTYCDYPHDASMADAVRRQAVELLLKKTK